MRLLTSFPVAVLAAVLLAGCAGKTSMKSESPEASPAGTALSAESAVEQRTSNALGNPEGMVDRLVMFRTAEQFAAGKPDRVSVEPMEGGRARLVLADVNPEAFPRSGRWVSAETAAEFPFTELLPSWNVEAPPDTGLVLQVKVRNAATQTWSPWLYMGQWGRTIHSPERTLSFDGGAVHVDILRLTKPADAFQTRVSFSNFGSSFVDNPSLRLLTVAYSGVVADPTERARLASPTTIQGEWARSLPVPFYAQANNGDAIGGETCSPTSTSMVMAYRGREFAPVENCMAIFDPEYGIFGNWGRAVARAGETGLDAWLIRIRDREQLKAQIAAGNPVVASIRFREGEFPSNVLKSTGGHLIVLRGMTPEGDVIVNDPASRERGEGVVYKWEELRRAWVERGGVGYVIGAPLPP